MKAPRLITLLLIWCAWSANPTVLASVENMSWLYFQSTFDKETNQVNLAWSMLKENDPNFEIERSINGIANFEVIGTLESKDELNGEFHFLDKLLPLLPARLYYRIKATSPREMESYSELVMVESPGVHRLSDNSWRVFPNPIVENSARLAYAYELGRGEKINVKIFDQFDRSWEIQTDSLQQLNFELDRMLAILPKGLLIFHIQTSQHQERLKVINR
ncbi:hypothetical protein KI659_07585 [Litoribacter alkaliphilus]|uniref:T9SS type A sorting domain-containing protein n=1 Tax=Litoribacter ruber TaxID=702568 RepID=A0AAP2CHS3_9BACT|nr:hypothetical protein [Litoribacter alkaliphilus]MBS9523874.1 hypothetical protein [Litoribacter alkaliphilus]